MSKSEEAKAPTQEDLSKAALALKEQNATPVSHPTDRTADTGMQNIEHKDQAPSGALDDVGDKPARERSRERR
ncbi:hypothetical protein [Yoonia sp.]|uniref:hypothetical protein n=1 Tax=Yoonia sp. TaxID=2212373 RepID=UPI00391D3F59